MYVSDKVHAAILIKILYLQVFLDVLTVIKREFERQSRQKTWDKIKDFLLTYIPFLQKEISIFFLAKSGKIIPEND
jgi:hypothetical protein